jgi:hypothetical protein
VAKESEDESLLRFVPLAADQDAVAVMIRSGARHGGLYGGIGETSDSPDELRDLLLFDAELFRVIKMLVLTASALTEVGAAGTDPAGGGFQDAEESGAGELFFDLSDFGFDDLTGDDEGDEDDQRLVSGNALAAEGEVFDGELEHIAEMNRGARHGSIRLELGLAFEMSVWLV